jgi:hypothetical protein
MNESTEGYGWRLVTTAALEHFFEPSKPRRSWLGKRRHADLAVRPEGSLWILWPLTQRAEEWGEEHLPSDGLGWAGGIVVKGRYIADILQGAEDDGLVIVAR